MIYVILGFLLIRKLTQYDLYQALQKNLSPFYQPSYGSIQSAFKRLEEKGYISVEKTTENGRRKNIYSINESGKEFFKVWMLGELNLSKLEEEISTKLFFLGLLPNDDRKLVIKIIIDFLEDLIIEYKQNEVKYKNIEVLNNFKDVAKFQFMTLEFGIQYYESSLKWFKQLLKKMEVN